MNLHPSIINDDDLAENRSFHHWLGKLQREQQQSHQRSLLVIQGEHDWSLRQIDALSIFEQRVTLSNQLDVTSAIPLSKADTLLGTEVDCVIYDQFSGLNIDVMCMAAGLIRAGGLLVLLLPDQVQADQDPFGRWQDRYCEDAYFWHYLQDYFQSSEAVMRYQQSADLPAIRAHPRVALTELPRGLSKGQRRVLAEMESWFIDPARPLFLLTADRGRGKSTLLGKFMGKLERNSQMLVTAASRMQAAVLLKTLGQAQVDRFISPDELIRRQQPVDFLVIDEAAMLPNSMLQQCIGLANKVLMATTTGGYEGTGQGFLLKFLAGLQTSQYVHAQLHDPIRWGAEDQLEDLINRMLLLKSHIDIAPNPSARVEIRAVTHRQLSQDRGMLQAVYGLLVSAHYRTRPSDLRQLMENENQRLFVAVMEEQIVAVLQLNLEGGFNEALCKEVFMGRRRPQGHLFAQMITAQAGLKDFATNRGYRIQRITVHESVRRQGIGRLLVAQAQQQVEDDGLDYLASSFALDADTALFWKQLGFQLVHIGSGKGKSTGQQAIAVMKAESPCLRRSMQTLKNRVQENLPVWLLTYCNRLAWPEVKALLALLSFEYILNTQECDEIIAFTDGFRGLDLSQAALQKVVINALQGQTRLSDWQQQILIEKILLNRDWSQVAIGHVQKGRKSLTREIRKAIKICYEHVRAKY